MFSNSFAVKANLVCRNIIRSANHKFIALAVTLGLLVVILHSYCIGLKLLFKIVVRVYSSSPNIVGVKKMRRMRWVGHVARVGERRGVYKVLVGKPEGKSHLEDLGIDGRIILRLIFQKWNVGVWTGSSWLRLGTGGGHL